MPKLNQNYKENAFHPVKHATYLLPSTYALFLLYYWVPCCWQQAVRFGWKQSWWHQWEWNQAIMEWARKSKPSHKQIWSCDPLSIWGILIIAALKHRGLRDSRQGKLGEWRENRFPLEAGAWISQLAVLSRSTVARSAALSFFSLPCLYSLSSMTPSFPPLHPVVISDSVLSVSLPSWLPASVLPPL